MLRAAWLSAENDVRLLVRDPVVLLMLLLAPVVIITVAGYSLGAIYGDAGDPRVVPVVDRDGGEVGARVVAVLREEPSVRIELQGDLAAARRRVAAADGPAVAVEIPRGTTAAMRAGRSPRLVLFVDPAKRIEANAIAIRIADLCRRATEEAQATAQSRLLAAEKRLRRELAHVAHAVGAGRARAADALRAQLDAAFADVRRQIETAIRVREAHARQAVASELDARRTRLDALRGRLSTLRQTESAFRDWFSKLQEIAGRHAGDIPPPPPFPALPSDAELDALAQPIAPPPADPAITVPTPSITLPPVELPAVGDAGRIERLPGVLGMTEASAIAGAPIRVNAFDQYVPGFGITFLLIGMMLGIALTLFDERAWGTLQRLQAGGVPLTSLLLGKLFTRFTVGVVQMIVLFAVGRVLFGISLGRAPLGLLLPTIGISFAGAGLGLIVPAVAQSHDGVMPLGVMLSMAIAGIGGCWWPLDFEPSWMSTLAQGLPTTWTMQAYNDLMIRRMPWHAALRPCAVTLGIGAACVAIGIAANLARERRG